MMIATPFFVNADTLTRQLELGMTGSDVSLLQTFLAKDITIYPQGLVTGYFGSLTKSAVSNFQARNGIATVGRVGPITLASINASMGASGDVSAPQIANIRVNSGGAGNPVVRWTTNEPAAGIVYYSTTFPSMNEDVDGTVGGTVAMTDTLLRISQDVTIAGLQPNTTYYYVIYSKDGSGNVQLTWPTTFRTQ